MKIILTLLLTSVMGFAMQTCSKSDMATKSDSKTITAANSDVAAANKTVMTPAPDVHNEDDAARISLEDAKKDFDKGNVVFVDTRAEAAFNVEHIKGAINIPAETFQTRYTEVPKDKKIIAYCSWPSEHTSARAVQILNEKGIKNAYALVGGTAVWKNAGYPMEEGKK